MEITILGDRSSLFALSQCVTCSPVWWICTTWISNFRDDDIWPQLPELFRFCWGLKNNSSDLRKKTTNWGFLVVVIVQLSYCLKLQRAYCSSSFSHPLFSGVIFEVYWRVRELIKKERKQVTRCGGAEPFHHPPIPVVPTDNYTAFPVSQPSQTLLSSSKIAQKKKNRKLLTV